MGRQRAAAIVVAAYKSALCIHSECYHTKSTSVMAFPWDVLYSGTLRILRNSLSERWRTDHTVRATTFNFVASVRRIRGLQFGQFVDPGFRNYEKAPIVFRNQ